MKKYCTLLVKNLSAKKIFRFSLLFLFALFMLQSCIKKEEFDFDRIAAFDYDPNIAVPLIHSELTLRDIINDYDTNNLFVEDGTNFLYLIYNSTIFSQRADELITVSDQNVNSGFNFSPGAIPVGDSASYTYSTNYTFTNSYSERYDSIRVKSGIYNFNLSANINHNSRFYITLPTVKKNGVPFKKTIVYNSTGGTVNITQTFDLSDYTISFNSGNQIPVQYKVTSYGDGNADNSPYNISMGESFQNLKYNIIFGYLGQRTFNISQDSVFIEIFKNNVWGSLNFEDPKLRIYTNNGYGMPIAVNFDLLEGYSPVNPPYVVNVSSSLITGPWVIGAPTFAQLGQIVQSVKVLDKTNSNFNDAVNLSPRWITYHINALSNASGNPATDQNFVIDTSRFAMDVEVELPLHGSAWDFRLQDTLDQTFGDDIDKAEWVKFKINTDNGFPIDARVQLYFVDSLYHKIDSLLSPFEQVVFAAPIGPPPEYRVTASNHKYVETMIYKDRLTNLKNTYKILVYTRLATINGGASIVKIYSDYTIDVKVGIQAQGHYQVNIHD